MKQAIAATSIAMLALSVRGARSRSRDRRQEPYDPWDLSKASNFRQKSLSPKKQAKQDQLNSYYYGHGHDTSSYTELPYDPYQNQYSQGRYQSPHARYSGRSYGGYQQQGGYASQWGRPAQHNPYGSRYAPSVNNSW